MSDSTNKLKPTSHMSGAEAWEAKYKATCAKDLEPIDAEIMKQTFLLGVAHAVAYIRAVQDE